MVSHAGIGWMYVRARGKLSALGEAAVDEHMVDRAEGGLASAISTRGFAPRSALPLLPRLRAAERALHRRGCQFSAWRYLLQRRMEPAVTRA